MLFGCFIISTVCMHPVPMGCGSCADCCSLDLWVCGSLSYICEHLCYCTGILCKSAQSMFLSYVCMTIVHLILNGLFPILMPGFMVCLCASCCSVGMFNNEYHAMSMYYMDSLLAGLMLCSLTDLQWVIAQ